MLKNQENIWLEAKFLAGGDINKYMKTHYLMIKVHNVTGLKYLCKKTTDDVRKCYRYLGSGKFWQRHLIKHGKDITTTIIESSQNLEKFAQRALYWSKFYDVVNSLDWANLIEETGSNKNDTSFEQMIKNRVTTFKKLKGTKEYQLIRKKCGKETKKRQLGLSMKERMGPNWTDPRKGKKMKDIYKPGHLHSQIKPYKIILNDGEQEWIFGAESEVYQIGLNPAPTLYNMKQQGYIYIKNIVKNRTKHNFKKGDKLSFEWISLEDYKSNKNVN